MWKRAIGHRLKLETVKKKDLHLVLVTWRKRIDNVCGNLIWGTFKNKDVSDKYI